VSAFKANTPRLGKDVELIVVDNSHEWSPAIRGITDTDLGSGVRVEKNAKPHKHHAAGLEHVLNVCGDCDYFVTLETDVLVLRSGWLENMIGSLKDSDYAAGAWHHEQFINPSCTIYRTSVLREMYAWSRANKSPYGRWGDGFHNEAPLDPDPVFQDVGPFDDRRGWPPHTKLKTTPSGLMKGVGHYEPGQQLYHWAIEAGYTATTIPSVTVNDKDRSIPIGTYYMGGQDTALDLAFSVHLWAGTRALDVLKHEVNDRAIIDNTQFWLQREACYWIKYVPESVRKKTIDLIRKYGWYTRTPNNRELGSVDQIQGFYRQGGVHI
jgi:hypothetical protein